MHIVVEYRWIYTSACSRHEEDGDGGGGAWIERKHPINDVDEIVSSIVLDRSILHAFPKKDNPSFSRMERNSQGWMDGYGWSWSGRGHVACDRSSCVSCTRGRDGGVKKRT